MVTTPGPSILSDPTWLSSFLDTVLTKAVQALGASAPTRRYVSAGPPVPDCGQLTVHLDRLRPSVRPTASQQEPMGSKHVVTVADVVVTLQRCVTSLTSEGGIPDAATLDADGKELADLAQALWFGLLAAAFDGTLFPTQARPPVLFREMPPIATQAGLAGWRLSMEVTLS